MELKEILNENGKFGNIKNIYIREHIERFYSSNYFGNREYLKYIEIIIINGKIEYVKYEYKSYKEWNDNYEPEKIRYVEGNGCLDNDDIKYDLVYIYESIDREWAEGYRNEIDTEYLEYKGNVLINKEEKFSYGWEDPADNYYRKNNYIDENNKELIEDLKNTISEIISYVLDKINKG